MKSKLTKREIHTMKNLSVEIKDHFRSYFPHARTLNTRNIEEVCRVTAEFTFLAIIDFMKNKRRKP